MQSQKQKFEFHWCNKFVSKFTLGVLILNLAVCNVRSNKNLEDIADGLEESPIVKAKAAVGGTVVLPCDIKPPEKGDTPLLIVFFRKSKPIYSVDARNRNLSTAIHWTTADLKRRSPTFNVLSLPYGLVLPAVMEHDEGDYHCRIDFKSSPTRNLRVILHVAVPPKRLLILDEYNTEVEGIIGPYPVGVDVTLTCIAYGGKPLPKITWIYGGLPIKGLSKVDLPVTLSKITLPKLKRKHFGRTLTCQAQTSDLMNATMTSVILDMTLAPLDVEITKFVTPMEEGKKYYLKCISTGSRPSAQLSWFMNTILISRSVVNFTENNSTISTVPIKPTRADHGSSISCRAKNTNLPGTAIEDTVKLVVLYPPSLSLMPGRTLELENIKEGDDVYFECKTEANPPVDVIKWFLNDSLLRHNVSSGVIVSNRSLVLQRVRRQFSGNYKCKAANSLQSAVSNPLKLVIKYPPECEDEQQEIYGGARLETLNVTCSVRGQPEPSIFRWTFNTSSDEESLASSKYSSVPGKSVLSYKPQTSLDFGSLFCWGENILGRQRDPCVFKVVPASSPEPVKDCYALQNSSAEVMISCSPGWNGGLSQLFTMQIRKDPLAPFMKIIRNQESPIFFVSDLPAGTEIYFSVIAENSRGESPPATLIHFTPIVAEGRLSVATVATKGGSISTVDEYSMIGVVLGIVSVIATLLGAVIILAKVRMMKRGHSARICKSRDGAAHILKENEGYDPSGPDVVLVTADEQPYTEKGFRPGDKIRCKDESAAPTDSYYTVVTSGISTGLTTPSSPSDSEKMTFRYQNKGIDAYSPLVKGQTALCLKPKRSIVERSQESTSCIESTAASNASTYIRKLSFRKERPKVDSDDLTDRESFV